MQNTDLLSWMAWTWPTAAFFAFILLCLVTMSVWEFYSPGGAPRHERRGARAREFPRAGKARSTPGAPMIEATLALRRLDAAAPGFERDLAELTAFESAQDSAVDATVERIVADLRARGDRLFISLLGSAFIFLAWLAFMGPPLWAPLGIAIVYAIIVFRWV